MLALLCVSAISSNLFPPSCIFICIYPNFVHSVLIASHLHCFDEFVFEVSQRLVIQVELALQARYETRALRRRNSTA
jgi:hypothetical protein